MGARTVTDLVVTEVRGIFLIKTLSGSWYQLICESDSDGNVRLSGGKNKLPTERVRSYKSTIRIGAKMFFWRQNGKDYIRSTDVTKIYDITSMDEVSVARLMSA